MSAGGMTNEGLLVLHLLRGDSQSGQQPRTLTVPRMVDMLGWSQTFAQRVTKALDDAGWLDSEVKPEGSPSGGPAVAYLLKPGVMGRIPDLPKGVDRPWIPAKRAG